MKLESLELGSLCYVISVSGRNAPGIPGISGILTLAMIHLFIFVLSLPHHSLLIDPYSLFTKPYHKVGVPRL